MEPRRAALGGGAAGVLRRVVGGELEPALAPVLATTLAGDVGLSALFGYQGVWAVRHLGASASQLSVALAAQALLAALGGVLGGRLSDRAGRVRVLVASWLAVAVLLAAMAATSGVAAGLTLLALCGLCMTPTYAVSLALIADTVPPDRQEAGFAAFRVANNLGIVCGPPLAGLVLGLAGWGWTFGLAAAVVAATGAASAAVLPRPPRTLAGEAHARSPASLVTASFGLVVACYGVAAIAFVASETVLPVAAVTRYGLAPSVWGLVFALNPLLVVLFQLRVARWSAGMPLGTRLPLAMALMGPPFLLLPLAHGLGEIAAVVVVFVIGEMLWVPASQALVVALSPAARRGSAMGVVGAASNVADAVGPLAALQLLGRAGDVAMWAFIGGCCTVAAGLGVVAARAAGSGAAAAVVPSSE